MYGKSTRLRSLIHMFMSVWTIFVWSETDGDDIGEVSHIAEGWAWDAGHAGPGGGRSSCRHASMHSSVRCRVIGFFFRRNKKTDRSPVRGGAVIKPLSGSLFVHSKRLLGASIQKALQLNNFVEIPGGHSQQCGHSRGPIRLQPRMWYAQ